MMSERSDSHSSAAQISELDKLETESVQKNREREGDAPAMPIFEVDNRDSLTVGQG